MIGVDRISIRGLPSRAVARYTSRFKVTMDTTKTKTCTKIPVHKPSIEKQDALESSAIVSITTYDWYID